AAISNLLQRTLHKFAACDFIPSDYAPEVLDDGRTTYPHTIAIKGISGLACALRKIISNPEKSYHVFSSPDEVFSFLPLFPCSTLLGTFDTLSSLADSQLDLIFSVRGLVYVKAQQYIENLFMLIQKLRCGGILIDDGIRENFG